MRRVERERREENDGQSQRGREGRREWNGGGGQGPLAKEGGRYLAVWGSPSS